MGEVVKEQKDPIAWTMLKYNDLPAYKISTN